MHLAFTQSAVILAPIDDEDLENIILTRSPCCQAMLEQSRESIRAGKGLSEEQFWSAVSEEQEQ